MRQLNYRLASLLIDTNTAIASSAMIMTGCPAAHEVIASQCQLADYALNTGHTLKNMLRVAQNMSDIVEALEKAGDVPVTVLQARAKELITDINLYKIQIECN